MEPKHKVRKKEKKNKGTCQKETSLNEKSTAESNDKVEAISQNVSQKIMKMERLEIQRVNSGHTTSSYWEFQKETNKAIVKNMKWNDNKWSDTFLKSGNMHMAPLWLVLIKNLAVYRVWRLKADSRAIFTLLWSLPPPTTCLTSKKLLNPCLNIYICKMENSTYLIPLL